jgi:hypothetical protein
MIQTRDLVLIAAAVAVIVLLALLAQTLWG